METSSRDHEISLVFAEPWVYPGLPIRQATSCRLIFGEHHHLLWSTWTIFDEEQNCYARRIEWPCAMGASSQTGIYTRTFASESSIDRCLVEALCAEVIAVSSVGLPLVGQAVGIDGGERNLGYWQGGVQKALNWKVSAKGSPIDVWFTRAAALLDAHLPQSRSSAHYKIRPDEISSAEASNPRGV